MNATEIQKGFAELKQKENELMREQMNEVVRNKKNYIGDINDFNKCGSTQRRKIKIIDIYKGYSEGKYPAVVVKYRFVKNNGSEYSKPGKYETGSLFIDYGTVIFHNPEFDNYSTK